MSNHETQAQKPTDDLLAAVTDACERKLDRAISPTTTIRARDVQRLGVETDVTRIGMALTWLESEVPIDERGFSLTVEPSNGQRHRRRYRLAEAGETDG